MPEKVGLQGWWRCTASCKEPLHTASLPFPLRRSVERYALLNLFVQSIEQHLFSILACVLQSHARASIADDERWCFLLLGGAWLWQLRCVVISHACHLNQQRWLCGTIHARSSSTGYLTVRSAPLSCPPEQSVNWAWLRWQATSDTDVTHVRVHAWPCACSYIKVSPIQHVKQSPINLISEVPCSLSMDSINWASQAE